MYNKSMKRLFQKIINSNQKIHCVIFICIVFVFRLCFLIYNFNFKYQTMENTETFQVMVIELQTVTDKKISYLVKYDNNKFILNIYTNNYNTERISKEFLSYKYGDILQLSGKITIPSKLNNPYEFDYKKYLNSNNIDRKSVV